jgi:uncharacterized protein YqhQ
MSELHYGGQAVMEGVMMRGRTTMAVAVRAPNGRIIVHSEPLNKAIYGSWIAKVPFVRGITMLWDTMVLGIRTLMFSADIATQGLGISSASSDSNDSQESIFTTPLAWGSVALSLSIAVGLFFVMPALFTKFIDPYLPTSLISNLVEGLIRLTFVLGYVWAVGHLPDIRRVFAYHGAEHKTVHAYEHGQPLTVQAVRTYTTSHERCGTSFILFVVVISVLIFSLFGRPGLFWRVTSRIVLLPVIVGIAYEWLKFGAKHADSKWMRALLAPGLVLQRLTTREPDDEMIEVAIAALERVLEEDGRLQTAQASSSPAAIPS